MTNFRDMKDTPVSTEPIKPMVACNLCRGTTLASTAMEYGGMCSRCFKDYCNGAQQNRIGLNHGR